MPVAFMNRNPAFRKADILTHQSLSFTNPEPRVYEHCDARPPLDRACSLNRFNFIGGGPTLPSRRLPFPAYLRSQTGKSLSIGPPRTQRLKCCQVAASRAGLGRH